MSRNLKGSLPGFSFEVEKPSKNGTCLFCQRSQIQLLLREEPENSAAHADETWKGICEFCAHGAAWLWARIRNETPDDAPLGISPERTCRVLALRTPNLDDIVDSLTDPRQAEALDVLSIVAPTYGPPSKAKPRWTIPGGDIDPDEGLKDAAVRILLETTGAKTWPHVVETLWTGLDERGRLCHVLLARGFYLPATRYECAKGHVTSNVSTDDTIECGAVIGGQECKVLAKKRDGGKGAVWKSLVEVLSGPTAAPLVGIAVAVDLKKRALAQESALPNTLSVRLRSSANELVTLGLGRLAGVEPPGDMTNEERDERMFTIRSTLITPEEKSIVDAIISRQDEIDRMARPVTIGQREEDRGEGAGEETPYDEELSEEKDETNEDGFVRPPGPELNTR